ncbi:MAG TPA: hypothetical protein VLE89_02260 [Chlamydiales bacterium]|nr:hypothetical protein [Chlamydiales bacterium]
MKVLAILFTCFTIALCATDKLRVYDDTNGEIPVFKTSEVQEMTPVLNSIGVRFEQWEAAKPLTKEATQEEVIEAYKGDVERLKNENGYRTVDVLKMNPDSPKKVELRNKFLNEHTHTEDEVRFFVEGSGLFYLHHQGKVYIVLCEKGDLISIPANYSHWFDMGKEPYFTAIRFFIEPSGWVANFTKSPIAELFPRFE